MQPEWTGGGEYAAHRTRKAMRRNDMARWQDKDITREDD